MTVSPRIMFLNFHTALSLCSSPTGWWPLTPPLVSFSEAPLKCSEVMRENSTTPGVAGTGQIQDFALGDQDLFQPKLLVLTTFGMKEKKHCWYLTRNEHLIHLPRPPPNGLYPLLLT